MQNSPSHTRSPPSGHRGYRICSFPPPLHTSLPFLRTPPGRTEWNNEYIILLLYGLYPVITMPSTIHSLWDNGDKKVPQKTHQNAPASACHWQHLKTIRTEMLHFFTTYIPLLRNGGFKIRTWPKAITVQTLTGQTISGLRAVLRVPVNVQESNCLKHNNGQFNIIFTVLLFDENRINKISSPVTGRQIHLYIYVSIHSCFFSRLHLQPPRSPLWRHLNRTPLGILTVSFIQVFKGKTDLTWLNVGLLCSLEQRSPCRQAPILK